MEEPIRDFFIDSLPSTVSEADVRDTLKLYRIGVRRFAINERVHDHTRFAFLSVYNVDEFCKLRTLREVNVKGFNLSIRLCKEKNTEDDDKLYKSKLSVLLGKASDLGIDMRVIMTTQVTSRFLGNQVDCPACLTFHDVPTDFEQVRISNSVKVDPHTNTPQDMFAVQKDPHTHAKFDDVKQAEVDISDVISHYISPTMAGSTLPQRFVTETVAPVTIQTPSCPPSEQNSLLRDLHRDRTLRQSGEVDRWTVGNGNVDGVTVGRGEVDVLTRSPQEDVGFGDVETTTLNDLSLSDQLVTPPTTRLSSLDVAFPFTPPSIPPAVRNEDSPFQTPFMFGASTSEHTGVSDTRRDMLGSPHVVTDTRRDMLGSPHVVTDTRRDMLGSPHVVTDTRRDMLGSPDFVTDTRCDIADSERDKPDERNDVPDTRDVPDTLCYTRHDTEWITPLTPESVHTEQGTDTLLSQRTLDVPYNFIYLTPASKLDTWFGDAHHGQIPCDQIPSDHESPDSPMSVDDDAISSAIDIDTTPLNKLGASIPNGSTHPIDTANNNITPITNHQVIDDTNQVDITNHGDITNHFDDTHHCDVGEETCEDNSSGVTGLLGVLSLFKSEIEQMKETGNYAEFEGMAVQVIQVFQDLVDRDQISWSVVDKDTGVIVEAMAETDRRITESRELIASLEEDDGDEDLIEDVVNDVLEVAKRNKEEQRADLVILQIVNVIEHDRALSSVSVHPYTDL